MSQPVLESVDLGDAPTSLRHPLRHNPDEALVLSEIDPDSVVDHLDDADAAIELITFGTTRECCPQCRDTHLRLVLRQRRVRLAHLFCAECHRCFDAHYGSGNSALSI